MKKVIIFLFVLAMPMLVFAGFNPATLTNGFDRVAVKSEAMANSYFAKGYTLEGGALGSGSGQNVYANMSFLGETKIRTKVDRGLIASTTLRVADSGTIYSLASTTGFNITLPAVGVSKGVSYKFVIGTAFATTNYTITSKEGDNIEGSLIVAGAVVDCDANDVITSVADGENLGDFVEVYSDGVKWFVGQSGALTTSKMTCSG